MTTAGRSTPRIAATFRCAGLVSISTHGHVPVLPETRGAGNVQPHPDRAAQYQRAARSLAAVTRIAGRGCFLTRGLISFLLMVLLSLSLAAPLYPTEAHFQAKQSHASPVSLANMAGFEQPSTHLAEQPATNVPTVTVVGSASQHTIDVDTDDRRDLMNVMSHRPIVFSPLPTPTTIISETRTVSETEAVRTTDMLSTTLELSGTRELTATATSAPIPEPTPETVPAAISKAALTNTCASTGLVEIPVNAPLPLMHPIAAESFARVRAEVKAASGVDALAGLGDVLRSPDYRTDKAGVGEYSWHKAGRAIDLDTRGGFHVVPERVHVNGHTYQYHRVYVRGVDITAIFLKHGWSRIGAQGNVLEWWHFEYHPEHLPWAVAMRQVWSLRQLQASYPHIAWKRCPRGPLPRISVARIPRPSPTVTPTVEPTPSPTAEPTVMPTIMIAPEPAVEITVMPTVAVVLEPAVEPTAAPTADPAVESTVMPTAEPTVASFTGHLNADPAALP